MRGLLTWWARGAPRRTDPEDWRIRLQRGWRGWFRRWAWALAACLVAWGLGVWLHAQTWLDYVQTGHEVRTLQAQLAAAPVARHLSRGDAAVEAMPPLPTTDQAAQLWGLLPHALAQHQVRLLAMQPVNEAMAAPLPSEAMTLRLQARFENWAGLWAVMTQMGPVWTMDRLRVTPSVGVQGVDIEVVWRIWSRAQDAVKRPHGETFIAAIPQWPAPFALRDGASVFEDPRRPAAHKAVSDARPVTAATVAPETLALERVFSNEPERTPMQPLRVIGIWRHGTQAEVLVANPTHWFRVQEGRVLSLEGHRLWRIGHDDIQVRDPRGRTETLKLETMPP